MKRVILFILTNLAVMLVLGIVTRILGVDRYLSVNGIDYGSLFIYAGVIGFGGSYISLLMSKTMAKWSTGANVIKTPSTPQERWLVDTVGNLSRSVGLSMPEVAIYKGAPNAFATGPSASNSLVAVSTGLLDSMNKAEVEAVLAHEISHVKNGDMVTLTLIQGVVNTFVFFFARVVGSIVDQMLRRNNDENTGASGVGLGYMASVFVCELVFGILASLIVMAFSRQREYRADSGAAQIMGSPKAMIAALQRLGSLNSGGLPKSIAAFGINGGGSLWSLFASHPPIEERIAALKSKI